MLQLVPIEGKVYSIQKEEVKLGVGDERRIGLTWGGIICFPPRESKGGYFERVKYGSAGNER